MYKQSKLNSILEFISSDAVNVDMHAHINFLKNSSFFHLFEVYWTPLILLDFVGSYGRCSDLSETS